jgi:hypothetical protein
MFALLHYPIPSMVTNNHNALLIQTTAAAPHSYTATPCHTETDFNAQAAAPRIRNHHIRTLNARLARRVPNLLARLALSDTRYSHTSKREITRIHQIRKIIRCERPTSGPEHASKPMVRCKRSIHSVQHHSKNSTIEVASDSFGHSDVRISQFALYA